MSQPDFNKDRARESAEARAALERRAAELGVTPFDAEEWLALTVEDPGPEDVAREVEEFLRVVRELRDTPTPGSAG